jgi:hypothetical protein
VSTPAERLGPEWVQVGPPRPASPSAMAAWRRFVAAVLRLPAPGERWIAEQARAVAERGAVEEWR